MTSFDAMIRTDISVDAVRASLPCKREPYWQFLSHCRHVGYQKREGKPTYWVARFRTKQKRYRTQRVGPADCIDFPYSKAVLAAREWFARPENRALAADPYPVGPCQTLRVCPIGEVYSVGHALHDYLEWKRIAGAPTTFLIALSLINCHIIPRLSDIPLEDFTGIHHREFAKEILETPPKRGNRPIGPRCAISTLGGEELRKRKKTLNTLTSFLRVAFQMAWENGRIKSDRAWRCLRRVPNVDRPRLLHLTRDECRDLLGHCRADLRNLVLGALYTGCRSIELIRLTVGDVARDGYGIYVAPQKSYQPRFVFLPDEGMAFFIELCRDRSPREPIFPRKDGKAWPYRHYRNVFKAAVRRSSVPDEFTFHGLRHTYASQLVQAGTPLSVVAEQLGHRSTATVSHTYGHLAPQIRESEVRQRFGWLDPENAKLAKDKEKSLAELRVSLHGHDWRSYAQINDQGSWPRSNFFRGDADLVALCRGEEARPS